MKIKPIKELRDTNHLSDELHSMDEPVFITKNGYEDLVIMSQEVFDGISRKESICPSNKEEKGCIHLNRENAEPSDCFGYVTCSTAVIRTKVADPVHNEAEMEKYIVEAEKEKSDVLVFGELTTVGYTCGDLFLNDDLLNASDRAVEKILSFSKEKNMVIFLGAPFRYLNKLYNTSIVIQKGRILGIITKKSIPNYNEFYEARYFHPLEKGHEIISAFGQENVPFGEKLIFVNDSYPDMKLAGEICEDLWVPDSPSVSHAMNGATIIANLSGSNELIGKKEYRELLVRSASAKLCCGYLYCSCGQGESTTDMVFGGHCLIGENGGILKESELFTNELLTVEIDVNKLVNERRRMSTFRNQDGEGYCYSHFSMPLQNKEKLIRKYSNRPFIPYGDQAQLERAKAILKIQVEALKTRLSGIHCKKAVIGLSGGLDSTLALLVTATAFDELGLERNGITTITMPSDATSDLTYNNAYKLGSCFHTSFLEIPIKKAVEQHFSDIRHDMSRLNNAYENVQARERTQILMDYANDIGGIVIGTGDLSEECLGWSTYNGDHMSMYNPNASIPKTLVRFLVDAYGKMHPETREVLNSILETPISPELLPKSSNEIAQKTEDIIGPYELHDFFIYHLLRHNFSYRKILYLALLSFKDIYPEETIRKTLDIFTRRFYGMQFKRSCCPDGVKVGSVSVSPRADLRLPSDISGALSFIERD